MNAHPVHHIREAASHFTYTKKSPKDFLTNWVHPIRGIQSTVKLESSLRVEIVALPLAVLLGTKRKINSPGKWLMLIVPIVQVLMFELLNTSVEELVRDSHPRRSPHYRRAMDAGSGAVLLAIGVAMVCAAYVLLGPSRGLYEAMSYETRAHEQYRLMLLIIELQSNCVSSRFNRLKIYRFRLRIAMAKAQLKVLDKCVDDFHVSTVE